MAGRPSIAIPVPRSPLLPPPRLPTMGASPPEADSMTLRPALIALLLPALLPAVGQAARPFDARDMVTLDRVSSPTLSPDGRTRPPHLRSWRDGWRQTACRTCSPNCSASIWARSTCPSARGPFAMARGRNGCGLTYLLRNQARCRFIAGAGICDRTCCSWRSQRPSRSWIWQSKRSAIGNSKGHRRGKAKHFSCGSCWNNDHACDNRR